MAQNGPMDRFARTRPGAGGHLGGSRLAVAATLLGCFMAANGWEAAAATTPAARLAAARCASCHSSTETIHSTVPLLEGQPKAYFISQWRAFRDGKRTAPVMVSLAAELSERDINALAEHYAAMPPPANVRSSGSEVGRGLADRLRCSSCHGSELQGTSAGAARLAGQKARYTAWSLQLMRSGTRSHGSGATPDPMLASLSNEEIEHLAAHLASLP